jgi:hypothetical protein
MESTGNSADYVYIEGAFSHGAEIHELKDAGQRHLQDDIKAVALRRGIPA